VLTLVVQCLKAKSLFTLFRHHEERAASMIELVSDGWHSDWAAAVCHSHEENAGKIGWSEWMLYRVNGNVILNYDLSLCISISLTAYLFTRTSLSVAPISHNPCKRPRWMAFIFLSVTSSVTTSVIHSRYGNNNFLQNAGARLQLYTM
jgi:hypothetical protein